MHFARKRFGQHFLTDRNIIEKIVQVLDPKPTEHLLEIGGGKGALTQPLLSRIDHLHVIEIDRDLCERLREKYPPSQLTLYEKDVLQFDFKTLSLTHRPLRIFGNLPYNISTPLLFTLLSFADDIQDMLFMLQKEVVLRLCALPGNKAYGRLSIMIQYAYQTTKLFDIKPNAFSPPPKVMSSIVRLVPYVSDKRPFPLADDFSCFARIVAKAFQQRRKTLRNALDGIVSHIDFAKAELDPIRRPETLSIAEFVRLSNVVRIQDPTQEPVEG